MISIDVFVLPGCSRCSDGLDTLKEGVAGFGPDMFVWNERNLLQNIDAAVDLGIPATPAIAINGKLAFTPPPSSRQFQEALAKYAIA